MDIIIDKIIKSRRKTIALEISRNAELIVRTPRFTNLNEIREIIRKNEKWIKEKLEVARQRVEQIPNLQFSSGETIIIQGEEFVIEYTDKGISSINHDQRKVFLSARLQTIEAKKEVITRLLKLLAKSVFKERIEIISRARGFSYKSLRVTSSLKRWGSCSADNKINLTWRLILAPTTQLDYVIIHELVHTKIKDHSRKFWGQVGEHYPDYKEAIRWFRENGHKLSI